MVEIQNARENVAFAEIHESDSMIGDETLPESGETVRDEEDKRSEADFTTEEATIILVADKEFTEADAGYALEELYQRGHIYYVDEEIYITPTDD